MCSWGLLEGVGPPRVTSSCETPSCETPKSNGVIEGSERVSLLLPILRSQGCTKLHERALLGYTLALAHPCGKEP
jgi:hypothetical protein